MPKLLFDKKIFDLQKASKLNEGDAIKVLGHIAGLIRSGNELPQHVIDYLAGALEAASVEQDGRSAMLMLAKALHLVVPQRRPSVNWYDVGHAVEMLLLGGSEVRAVPNDVGGLRLQFVPHKGAPKKSLTIATEDIAGLLEIDASTIRRHYQTYKKAKEEHDSIE